jgi:hypothetical protein
MERDWGREAWLETEPEISTSRIHEEVLSPVKKFSREANVDMGGVSV